MELRDFAASLGIVLQYIPGRRETWVPLPTRDHPRKKNGRIWLSADGSYAHLCNWEQGETQTWFADRKPHVDPVIEAKIKAEREAVAAASRKVLAEESAKRHAEAALLGAQMLQEARTASHAYLRDKGFLEARGRVDMQERLLIRVEDVSSGRVTGVQTIESLPEGGYRKLFLRGMRSRGGVHRLGPQGGETWLAEGYATGLSVEAALRSLCVPSGVLVTFSAQNLVDVAPKLRGGPFYVYADNDKSGTGQRVAEQSGLPWCMSDVVGEDANDEHMRAGIFAVRNRIQALRRRVR